MLRNDGDIHGWKMIRDFILLGLKVHRQFAGVEF